MAGSVLKVAPPALPQGTQTYFQTYQDQLNNVHRLFYNRLTSSFNALIDTEAGAGSLYTPYGAYSRLIDFNFAANNTATVVPLDTIDLSSYTSLHPGGGIQVAKKGIYNYQFSVQAVNTNNQIQVLWLWLRVNGIDVPNSASKYNIISRHGGSDGYVICVCNVFVQLAAEDYVDLVAATDQLESSTSDGIYLEAYAPQVAPFVMPAIPSVISTLSFVSNYT
jgi:hypothetical protein